MLFKNKKKDSNTVRCLTMNANTGKVEVVRIFASTYEMIKKRSEMLESLNSCRMLTELEQFELDNYNIVLNGCRLAKEFDDGTGKTKFKTIYDMYAAKAAKEASDSEASNNS